MDQILFTTGELEILVDLLVKLSQLRIRQASATFAEDDRRCYSCVLLMRTESEFIYIPKLLRICSLHARANLTYREIDLLREELWPKEGKRERKFVPQKISSKESKISLISFYKNCNLVSVKFVLNLSCEEMGWSGRERQRERESVTDFNGMEISACM